MIGWIFLFIFFIIVVSACCSSSDSSSSQKSTGNTTPKTYTSNNNYSRYAYCECPCCGAPYYDGYCEECGYPDINQGWIGENY
jgi:hypothetical protein